MKLISLISLILLHSQLALAAQNTALWLREMPAHMDMGAAFGQICNPSAKNISIKKITSDYGKVEIHTMVMKNNMMKMKEIKSLNIDSKSCVELKPGGMHLMILNIKKQASAGETRKFLIEFSNNTKTAIVAPTKRGS